MPEPTKCLGEHSIMISPEDQGRRRTWPNPRATKDAEWRALYSRDALTDDDIRALARAAGAYRMVFEATGRDFAPTHSAIRRALSAAPAPAEDARRCAKHWVQDEDGSWVPTPDPGCPHCLAPAPTEDKA